MEDIQEIDLENGTGAGILPFCVREGEVFFFFHRTFEGKKQGTWIDCGGGKSSQDHTLIETAAREFAEETGGLWKNEHFIVSSMKPTESLHEFETSEMVKKSFLKMLEHIKNEMKLQEKEKKRVWILKYHESYLMVLLQIDWIPCENFNGNFASISPKKREFGWISAKDIIEKKTSLPLYQRVCFIPNFWKAITEINQSYQTFLK